METCIPACCLQLTGAGKLHVMMVRGLCARWKQPVYYALDKDMTVETLSEVTRELERLQLKLVAAVSDMAPKNEYMWKQAGVTMDRPYTRHPVQPDVPPADQQFR